MFDLEDVGDKGIRVYRVRRVTKSGGPLEVRKCFLVKNFNFLN